MRMHGHAAHDDMKYVPAELVEHWASRDPLSLQEKRAKAVGADIDALRADVVAQVDAATEAALAMPMPDPQQALEDVFAEAELHLGDGDAPWSGYTTRGRREDDANANGNGVANGKQAA
jgi:pyruvate dehydrogenase E1 component alpha subunit